MSKNSKIDRKLYNIYKYFGVVAAVLMGGICVLTLAQIFGRMLGIVVPSADDFATFCLSTSSYLALAYVFSRNEHIRVTIGIRSMSPRVRRFFEAVSLIVGIGLTGFATWHMTLMVWETYQYKEMTLGLIAIPKWIPQFPLPVGMLLLLVAMVHQLVNLIFKGQVMDDNVPSE